MLFRMILAFVLGVAPAAAETLTVTSQYGEGRPQTIFWQEFAAQVEDALPGEYEFRIVTGGALGGEKEEAEAIRLGSITASLSTIANLTTWVPQGALLDLPFVFSGDAHIMRVLDGAVGEALRQAYLEQGFAVPAFIIFGDRHLLGDEPMPLPEDVAGKTVRSLQSDLHVAFWRALEADPVALPITEAYSALATGVVDAMDMTKSGFDALKLYEVAPVMTETAHITATGVVYFNRDFWDGLTDAHRRVFREASRRAATSFNERAATEQDEALARAVANGAELVEVDRGPWREATDAFVDDFVSEMGEAAMDALDTIRSLREPS